MKEAVIVGFKSDSIAVAQRDPFDYHKGKLRRSLDLKLKQVEAETFLKIGEACQKQSTDIIFILPSWRESSKEAEINIKAIRENNPNQKLIFIDPFAQSSTRYFNVLPYVDWFVKRQVLKDLDEYKKHLIGGSTFTDFVARHWGWDFTQWHVGSDIPEGCEHKILSGWNLGTAKRFQQALSKPKFWFNRPTKNIDIFCRLSLGSNQNKEWYCQYRIAAVEALKPLESDYKLAVSAHFNETGLISRRQYIQEMKNSRIVFSPFGWGENCWRDFEAVCYDCLLIKPSMAHINTQPNIFIEGETYVPVRWDFADLEEKCRYYLEHLDEANRIIENARRVYTEYFKQGGFLKTINQMIK